ncbi:ATP-binding protein [Uliginosibacterium sp. H3]|uniref:histidine kinase n=1 Tax=Uliginosibacterium silvisoli TaxID=3114758 RepID=A0ABU6K6I8_9RHOO|nr:ATP-binding protein [Uliginosibacterium sp. H3]
MNPQSAPPDGVARTSPTGPPSWLSPALKLLPVLAAGLCTACAWLLGGGMGAAIAAIACLLGWATASLSAHKLDALRDLQRRYRTNQFMQDSINAIPMPIFVKNRRGRLIMINDAYCEQRQLEREEILGKTASELAATPELARLIAEEDERVLGGGRIRKEERLLHPRTGNEMYQIVTKALSHTEADKPVIIGTFIDVTNIRLAERDARDALAARTRLHEFLQFVLDALPNPLFVKDAQHRYIMTNRAHTEATGLSVQELLGKRASDLMEQGVATRIEAHEDTMLADSEGLVFETEHTIADLRGQTRQEILRKVVGRDTEGQRVIIGTATNITSLRHAEARWQFAIEGAGDGLWDWDIPTRTTFYSPRWKAMQGFDEADIGDTEEERTLRIHPDDIAGARAALEVHLSGHAPIYICEFRLRARNGEYMWILDRGKVVERDAEGLPLRMLGIFTDISQQKSAEEELRHHRDRLKGMVEEQTMHLLQAKEEAEHANEAKSQFLANMSHELRTPMHAVLSFARLGEEKALKAVETQQIAPDKLAAYFQRIRESGDRLLGLLNDLLDLSKLEAGHMTLHLQHISLESVVQEALREFEASLLAGKLKADVSIQEGSTHLIADAVRLGQLVRNLLSNAIKFSPEGGTITLSIANSPAAAGIELCVADEGPGIPADELESIFDKFVQSSKTRNNAGGTGLGLPICREIVTAHQGGIFARNRPQRGSEFVVHLPRQPAA